MKAYLMGPSETKYTSRFRDHGAKEATDLHVKLEGVADFPHRIVLKDKEDAKPKGNYWEYPARHDCWDIVVKPSQEDQSFDLYFADRQSLSTYADPYDPLYLLEITLLDGTSESLQLIEGRKQLTANEELAILNDLNDEWPHAIAPEMICDAASEVEKTTRATEIIESYLDIDLKNMTFLDCGCGEGHMAQVAAKQAALSVGYDPKITFHTQDNLTLTSNFEQVEDLGPYDCILLFDVLDHADDPLKLLEQVKSVCKANTIVKVRCHPWISRHGGHCYRQLNLAYAHLIFTPQELTAQGVDLDNVQKVLTDTTYLEWFNNVGANVVCERSVKTPFENFFKSGIARKRILENTEALEWKSEKMSNLDIEFIDYELGFRDV